MKNFNGNVAIDGSAHAGPVRYAMTVDGQHHVGEGFTLRREQFAFERGSVSFGQVVEDVSQGLAWLQLQALDRIAHPLPDQTEVLDGHMNQHGRSMGQRCRRG